MKKRKYILVLVSMCGLIATGLGLLTNIAGLFFNPIAEEFGLQRGAVSLTLTIANLVYAFGGMAAPYFMKEKNLKLLLATGTLLTALPTAAMALASNIWVLYICNAIRGFASGLIGMVLATTVINNWFYANNGLATSIIMATSGIVGALFSPFVNTWIISYGWRRTYVIVGVIMVFFNLPSIFFLPSIRPQTKGMVPFGTKKKNSTASRQDNESIPVKKSLFLMAFLFALFACGITALPQHFPGIAESYTLSASVGAMMLSVSLIANSGGKLLMGILIDYIGAAKTILIYTVLVILGVLGMLLFHEETAMYIFAALIGLSYAIGTVGAVVLTKDTFGQENYSLVYPKISLGGTVGNAVYSSLIGYLYDFSGSYTLTIVITMIFLLVVLMSAFICYRSRKSFN